MAGVNKVILIGNLGRDPEVRYMPNGRAVVNVSLATSESWKDRNTGERQERTEWHYLVFYSPLAEIVGQYLRKGSSIFVEGRLQSRKWQDKNTGQDRYTTEIIANDMQMLGKRGEHSSDAPFEPDGMEGRYGSPTSHAAPASSYPNNAPMQPMPPSAGPAPHAAGHNDIDDDIPF